MRPRPTCASAIARNIPNGCSTVQNRSPALAIAAPMSRIPSLVIGLSAKYITRPISSCRSSSLIRRPHPTIVARAPRPAARATPEAARATASRPSRRTIQRNQRVNVQAPRCTCPTTVHRTRAWTLRPNPVSDRPCSRPAGLDEVLLGHPGGPRRQLSHRRRAAFWASSARTARASRRPCRSSPGLLEPSGGAVSTTARTSATICSATRRRSATSLRRRSSTPTSPVPSICRSSASCAACRMT